MADATQIVAGAEAAAEAIPGVIGATATSLAPLITLITSIIIAHHNASGATSWPTPAQVEAAFPADYAAFVNLWAKIP